jgi:hypothetical protein
MAAAMLEFFATGTPNIDRRESLAIRAVLDAAADPDSATRFVEVSC